jgi:hypothetical protein
MGRTLLIAGVFALLAMIYVPTPHRGYRLIFSSGDTSIAFFQLLVNVVFAALLGAILATIVPKLPLWAWRWGITGIALIAFFIIGALAWQSFIADAASQARSDEELADSQLAYHYPDAAKFTLRSAARNWRLALRFDEARRVENRINKISQPTQDWRNDPVVQASPQAPKALPASGNPFDFVPDAPTQAPQASSIPRARPVKKSMFDDLIPARTATPGR